MIWLCFHPCLQCHPSVGMVALNVLLSLTYRVTYSHQGTLVLYTQRWGGGGRGRTQVLSTVTLLIQFCCCQSNKPVSLCLLTVTVTHGRRSHLMECSASPAGSGVCPPICNHVLTGDGSLNQEGGAHR